MLAKYKSPFWDMHRADLQIGMYERAKELGVEFKFGALVTSTELETPSVTLSNGDRIDGDLIIAADGKLLLHLIYGCRADLIMPLVTK